MSNDTTETRRPRVVVFDYGSGNVHSAVKALEKAGADVTLSGDFAEAMAADGLFVPGVGAFDAVMSALEKSGGARIIDKRITGGKPVLGVCVGLQVMFGQGTERGVETEGLGQWPGSITELPAEVVPHMGWNTVRVPENTRLLRGLENERFYFVHSYAAQEWLLDVIPPFTEPALTWADHGVPFLAAIENGPLTATQFHPEKSGDAGIALLRNWLDTLPLPE